MCDGSPRPMFVSRVTVSPLRGSECLESTVVCKSGEYQLSVTMWMGSSLPACPAGMVMVVRRPSACTPSMVWRPSGSVFAATPPIRTWRPSGPPDHRRGAGGRPAHHHDHSSRTGGQRTSHPHRHRKLVLAGFADHG